MSADFLMGGFRNEPAWHGGGLLKKGNWQNATVAAQETGIEKFKVLAVPYFIQLPDGSNVQSENLILMRAPLGEAAPNWEELKQISKEYNVITISRICELLDPLCDNTMGGKWPVDTIGLLGKRGDRLFVALKMEDIFLNDDEKERHTGYLFLAEDYRGKGSLSIMHTNVRVVCQNTYDMAMGASSKKISIPHIGDTDAVFELRMQIEKAAMEMRTATVHKLEAMMMVALTAEQRRDVLEYTYPDKDEPAILSTVRLANEHGISEELLEKTREKAESAEYNWQHYIKRVNNDRVNTAALLEKFNDEYPKYANTAYAMVNVVNEYSDWRKGRHMDNLATQVLFGGRAYAKHRAVEAIENVANKVTFHDVIAKDITEHPEDSDIDNTMRLWNN